MIHVHILLWTVSFLRKHTGDSAFESKLRSGRVVTIAISEDRLPSYLKAASATGFKVEKIAGEGEEFLCRRIVDERGSRMYPPEVSTATVYGKGCIAVSIEQPEAARAGIDHTPFWDSLKSFE